MVKKEKSKGTNDEEEGHLLEAVKEHKKRIAHLGQRISDISDELALLKSELNGFRRGVARDMKNIVENIKE